MRITDDKKYQIVFANIGDSLISVRGDPHDIARIHFRGGVVAHFDQSGTREHDVALEGPLEAMEPGSLARLDAGTGQGDFRIHIRARHLQDIAPFLKVVFVLFLGAGDVVHACILSCALIVVSKLPEAKS
jgi:hypothetical protein